MVVMDVLRDPDPNRNGGSYVTQGNRHARMHILPHDQIQNGLKINDLAHKSPKPTSQTCDPTIHPSPDSISRDPKPDEAHHSVLYFYLCAFAIQSQACVIAPSKHTKRFVALLICLMLTSCSTLDIVGGGSHTCALSSLGTVKCFGWNYSGQLGVGDDGSRGDDANEMGVYLSEVDLGTNFTVIQITAGTSHTCALSVFNRVKCWGLNNYGQLGYNDVYSRGTGVIEMGDNLPEVDFGTDFKVVQIAAGGAYTCALCWGCNEKGQLGYGDMENRGDGANEMGDYLTEVDLGANFSVKQMAPGHFHTCALSEFNALKCFGDNAWGQLGYGDMDNRGDGDNEMGYNLSEVDLGSNFNVTEIVAGSRHTCALSQSNSAKCWGQGEAGKLGYEDLNNQGDEASEMGTDLSEVDLGTDFNVIQIAAGDKHTCALSRSNTVKCWGYNSHGELGLGDSTSRGYTSGDMGANLPELDLGTNFNAIQIVAGNYHTCAISQFITVKCWGKNDRGQLGYGDINNRGSDDMGDNLLEIDIGQGFATRSPTSSPTKAPSFPTGSPTKYPTIEPTVYPTKYPTTQPTTDPTAEPTVYPSEVPSKSPTMEPTVHPTAPTTDPTAQPTTEPTVRPSEVPSKSPTMDPTVYPTTEPTQATVYPSAVPSKDPTAITTVIATATGTEEPIIDATPTIIGNDIDYAIVTAVSILVFIIIIAFLIIRYKHKQKAGAQSDVEMDKLQSDEDNEPAADPVAVTGVDTLQVVVPIPQQSVTKYDRRDEKVNDDDDEIQKSPIFIKDPLIIVIAIGEYDKLDNIQDVACDVAYYRDVLCAKYKYEFMSSVDMEGNTGYRMTKKEVETYINDECLPKLLGGSLINPEVQYDGLLVALSGHGTIDSIVCSDREMIEYSSIREWFQSNNALTGIPRLFCVDACRVKGDKKEKQRKVQPVKYEDCGQELTSRGGGGIQAPTTTIMGQTEGRIVKGGKVSKYLSEQWGKDFDDNAFTAKPSYKPFGALYDAAFHKVMDDTKNEKVQQQLTATEYDRRIDQVVFVPREGTRGPAEKVHSDNTEPIIDDDLRNILEPQEDSNMNLLKHFFKLFRADFTDNESLCKLTTDELNKLKITKPFEQKELCRRVAKLKNKP